MLQITQQINNFPKGSHALTRPKHRYKRGWPSSDWDKSLKSPCHFGNLLPVRTSSLEIWTKSPWAEQWHPMAMSKFCQNLRISDIILNRPTSVSAETSFGSL